MTTTYRACRSAARSAADVVAQLVAQHQDQRPTTARLAPPVEEPRLLAASPSITSQQAAPPRGPATRWVAAGIFLGQRGLDGAGVQRHADRLLALARRARSRRYGSSGSAPPWRCGRNTSRPTRCRRSSPRAPTVRGDHARRSRGSRRSACLSTSAGPTQLSRNCAIIGRRRWPAAIFSGARHPAPARRWRRTMQVERPVQRPKRRPPMPRRSRPARRAPATAP